MWIGETIFTLLRHKARPGYEFVLGRETRIQTFPRPPTIWPEVWNNMSKEQRSKATEKWQSDEPKRSELRKARKIGEWIPDSELPAFRREIEILRERAKEDKIPEAPELRSDDPGSSSSLFQVLANESFDPSGEWSKKDLFFQGQKIFNLIDGKPMVKDFDSVLPWRELNFDHVVREKNKYVQRLANKLLEDQTSC